MNRETEPLPPDDVNNVPASDYLLAYREYYKGRLVVREGEYTDTFPSEPDNFLEGMGRVDETLDL